MHRRNFIGSLVAMVGSGLLLSRGASSARARQGGVVAAQSIAVGERGTELLMHRPAAPSRIEARRSGKDVVITIYANDARSFARRETQTRIRDRMIRAMRQA